MFNFIKAITNAVKQVIQTVASKFTGSSASKTGTPTSGRAGRAGFSGNSGHSGISQSTVAHVGRPAGQADSGGSSSQKSGRAANKSGKQKLLNTTPVSAELRVELSGTRLGRSVTRRMQHESTPLKVSSMDSKDYYSNYLKDHAHYKWHADTEKTLNKLVIFDPLGQNTSVSENGMGDFWGIYVLENLPDLMVIGYYHNLIDEYEANEAQIKLFDRLGYFDSDVLTEEQAERYFRRKNLAERQDELSALLSQEGTVEAYEKAVESVFNITIDDDGTLNRAKDYIAGHALPEDPINALKQLDYYYEGVNEFAGWLAEQTGASTYERSKVFQQYMGPITIARVSEIPQEGIADSKGFTQDHIIYDRFDVEKYGDEVMLPDLIIHELAHAFVGSAGFGDYRQSPLYDQALVDWMDAVLDAFPNADRNSATSGNEEIGGTPETIANFIQNLVTGAVQVTPEQQESLRPIIEDALAVNKLRHTPIPEMAIQLGTDTETTYTNTEHSDGINVRSMPNSTSTPLRQALNIGDTMVVLGQTHDRGGVLWFYVGINRGGFYDYGWVSEDATGRGSIETEGLPEIPVEATNPITLVR